MNHRAAAIRQAVRMLAGLAIAWASTGALKLHSGYWAMITVATVVQGNLGGTLNAGATQFAGTVLGGLLGMAGVWLRLHHLLPGWAVLLVVLPPLALASAWDQRLRTAPITALIVLLVTPTSGSSIDLALSRIGEIGWGSLIGILVSILVLPGRTGAALRGQVADTLRALGARAQAALTNGDTDDAALDARVRTALGTADATRDALGQEHALHLGDTATADPLLRVLRRLHTDVYLLARAAAATPPSARANALAIPVRAWFTAAADSLQGGETPAADAMLRATGLDGTPPASARWFSPCTCWRAMRRISAPA